jgi:tetratricopeptide (TPR) repeat protein
MQGQLDLALKDYNYFLDANPTVASVYDQRSRVYADLKQFGAALKDALKAQELGFPEDENYMAQLTPT